MRRIQKAEGGIRKAEIAAFSPVAHDGTDINFPPPALLRGLDAAKDQSYVLFGVARRYLPRMLFPLGGYRKPEIRDWLTSSVYGWPTSAIARKFVSSPAAITPISFAAGARMRTMKTRKPTGDIALADGTVVGRHNGIEGFTIGQRKGLRVAMGEPYYVTRIDAETRQVMIGRREELARRELAANRVNWLIEPPNTSFRAHVQIRYNSAAAPALVEPLGDPIASAFNSTTHATASPPARPPSATTATACWAAAGSNDSTCC